MSRKGGAARRISTASVVEAYSRHGSLRPTARELNCSPAIVSSRLKEFFADAARAATEEIEARRKEGPGVEVDPDVDWRHYAACLGHDRTIFFPVGNDTAAVAAAEAAKAVCRGCPVVDSCLRWALDNDERHGVWGGLDEGERLALRMAGVAS